MNKYCLEVSNYTLLPEANDTLPERLAKTALFLKIDPYFSFYFFIITFSQLYCLIIFLFPLHCAHVTNPASILPPYIWKKHSARLKDKIKEKACNCILSCGKQFCKYYLYKQQTETQTKNDIFRFCLNVFFFNCVEFKFFIKRSTEARLTSFKRIHSVHKLHAGISSRPVRMESSCEFRLWKRKLI